MSLVIGSGLSCAAWFAICAAMMYVQHQIPEKDRDRLRFHIQIPALVALTALIVLTRVVIQENFEFYLAIAFGAVSGIAGIFIPQLFWSEQERDTEAG